ncbi:MAG: hypothetical protein PVSMB7_26560 [Chloroflexota bacterium]
MNAAIRDYNLQAPEALQHLPISIEVEAERLAREVPEIDVATLPTRESGRRLLPWLRRRRRYE